MHSGNRRRVVVTGLGILSSIGNDQQEVLASLRSNRSGIVAMPEWKDLGFRSQVAGTIKSINNEEVRKDLGSKGRFMDVASLWSVLAAQQAVDDSGLTSELLAGDKVACIAGSGFSSAMSFINAADCVAGRVKRSAPYDVTRSMASSVSANIANFYGLKGRSYSIASACATSMHNIGHAAELIRSGECDIALSGGAEEINEVITCMFEGMRVVLSKSYNETPQSASRPYDKNRDGFVISGGAGMVVLEDYEHAERRGATIYGELLGFGASTDGHDIVQPDTGGDGCRRCMINALEDADCSVSEIDYINTHGTSTPVGDGAELKAIEKLFGSLPVAVSSTKSLTGHGIGATGAQELIYSLLMLKHQFLVASSNIENLDDAFTRHNILRKNVEGPIKRIMTNSFGFGGTNGTLVVGNV